MRGPAGTMLSITTIVCCMVSRRPSMLRRLGRTLAPQIVASVCICTCPVAASTLPPDCADPPGAAAPRAVSFSSRVLARVEQPSALAYDRRGTLYIADAGQGCVWRLQVDGHLTRLAASFDRPSGLAIAANGTVYVAEASKHAIRAVDSAGHVRTVATVGLGVPRALAIDDLNNLYVADAQRGALKIDPRGRLERLPIALHDPSGIASAGEGEYNAIFVSDADGLTVIHPRNWTTLRFSITYRKGAGYAQLQGFRHIGHPGALAALDDHSLLYTDASDGTVRYIDVEQYLGRIVAYKPLLLEHPLSIASHGAAVSVATQRGDIVQLSDLDLRKPLVPGLEDWLLPQLPRSGNGPSVAIIGTSMLWWNTDWPDSIPGQLQSALGDRMMIYPIVIPAGTVQGAEEYLAALGDARQINIALLQISAKMLAQSFGIPTLELMKRSEWKPLLRQGLADLERQLGARRIRLAVIAQPEEFEIAASPPFSLESSVAEAAHASGASVIDLYPAFARALASGARLYGQCDKHLQPPGRALAAQEIARFLNSL